MFVLRYRSVVRQSSILCVGDSDAFVISRSVRISIDPCIEVMFSGVE